MVTRAETPDIHSSSPEYATRFLGHAGKFFLERQTKAIEALIGSIRDFNVLDVGGGHGQLFPFFLKRGCRVTILGSDESSAQRLLLPRSDDRITYADGNFLDMPFRANSFDMVVSVRIVPHMAAWKRFLRELCRVAKTTVVIDYPSWCSLNALTPVLFPLKKGIEGNTRPYRNFLGPDLTRVLANSGFEVTGTTKQFVLPMFLHRALDSPRWLQTLEHTFSGVHLTQLLGSPVVLRADRHD